MTEAAAPDGHERFKELSALAHAGALSAAESAQLKYHLQSCGQCREIHDQYRLLVQEGIPLLAGVYGSGQEETQWDDAATRKRLLARIREADRRSRVGIRFLPAADRPHLSLWSRSQPFAVAVVAACLVLAIAGGGYHLGNRLLSGPKPTNASDNSFQKLLAEKGAAQEQLGVQENRILQLQDESSQREHEIARLKLSLRSLGDHSNDLAMTKTRTDEQLRAVLEERDALSVRLREAEQSNQSIQTDLVSLRAERDQAVQRTTALESKIDELTAVSREQERTLNDNRQYLASDRDIRELMGARKLYIADVFDVDSGSRTRKPFGRVFYTQGKSLIFYAFDLDPGVKNANAFQVWGRKEMAQGEQPRPMNLGILYMDSESNRRWVMRFDDPKQLAEIDAVFVTVEPHGGSPKPTSKPFLYALLRKEVNHP